MARAMPRELPEMRHQRLANSRECPSLHHRRYSWIRIPIQSLHAIQPPEERSDFACPARHSSRTSAARTPGLLLGWSHIGIPRDDARNNHARRSRLCIVAGAGLAFLARSWHAAGSGNRVDGGLFEPTSRVSCHAPGCLPSSVIVWPCRRCPPPRSFLLVSFRQPGREHNREQFTTGPR